MGRDERRALFGGSIHVGGKKLSVPMKLFRRVGVVVNVDGDLLPFLEAQQRPGKLAVVGGHGDDAIGGKFDGFGGNGKRVIRRAIRRSGLAWFAEDI